MCTVAGPAQADGEVMLFKSVVFIASRQYGHIISRASLWVESQLARHSMHSSYGMGKGYGCKLLAGAVVKAVSKAPQYAARGRGTLISSQLSVFNDYTCF